MTIQGSMFAIGFLTGSLITWCITYTYMFNHYKPMIQRWLKQYTHLSMKVKAISAVGEWVCERHNYDHKVLVEQALAAIEESSPDQQT